VTPNEEAKAARGFSASILSRLLGNLVIL